MVKSVTELTDHISLSEKEVEALHLAAWFHDTGFVKGHELHEVKSCEIAEDFLKTMDYDANEIALVKSLIMATQMVYVPQTILEKIMRDADSSHFAKKSYWETTDYLREELRILGIAKYSLKEWRDINIKLFRSQHQFYTDHALENWEPGKQKKSQKTGQRQKNRKGYCQKRSVEGSIQE